jgi:hypothetical protein
MKANELRIGNWVQFRHTETPVLITLADFVREYKEEHLEDYEPILLTEEWLERFGFVHNDKYCRFDSKMWNVRNRPEGKEISMNVWRATGSADGEFWGVTIREELTFDDVTPVAIQHVHQIQNLYFALTGKELTFDNQKQIR